MATVTAVYARIHEAGAEARIEIDYDDATETNPDLIAGRCVNGLVRPVTMLIQRGNGASWFTVEVSAGQVRSQNAGGPVRKLADIPLVALRA